MGTHLMLAVLDLHGANSVEADGAQLRITILQKLPLHEINKI